MTREVKLNELGDLFGGETYPLSVASARTRFDDVELVYADGSESLTTLLARVQGDQFESVDDVQSSILNVVPVEGVGEPGQSEGEG